MNGFTKPLAQWMLAVAIVGCLLAIFTVLAVLDVVHRGRAAMVVWARTRTGAWRAAVRARSDRAVLPGMRLRVNGTHDRDVAPPASADVRESGLAALDGDEDFAGFAEYGGPVLYEQQVRR